VFTIADIFWTTSRYRCMEILPMRHSLATSLCIVLFLLIQGCGSGGPDIARVEGVVTMDGKPLPRASVVFVPQGGRPSAAETDANGKYKLEFSGGRKGAIPGPNRVEITTFQEGGYETDGTVIPGAPEVVPAKYNRSSTLEFNVEPGKTNIANFDLDSKGKVMATKGEGY
jgi:hypothetical protein